MFPAEQAGPATEVSSRGQQRGCYGEGSSRDQGNRPDVTTKGMRRDCLKTHWEERLEVPGLELELNVLLTFSIAHEPGAPRCWGRPEAPGGGGHDLAMAVICILYFQPSKQTNSGQEKRESGHVCCFSSYFGILLLQVEPQLK